MSESRIEIDRERCIGAGQCQMTAPHVFDATDEGFSALLPGADDHAGEPIVAEAAMACPVQAITITEYAKADQA